MTPEERLILALKTQNRIVFGNTIGVDSNNECTVVSEDGTVRAIAGTPISSGSCVALQADDGQWYAVSARESGTVQKRTIYKRKNKPLPASGTGGPVKVLYLKDGAFYIGGDRTEPIEAYRIPDGYSLSGNASIDNLGQGLDDWLVNVRLQKSGKITLATVSPSTENRVEGIDIPRVFGGFGGIDPDYQDNEGFLPDIFGLPFFRCFQNGFYTAFGSALKIRSHPKFDFLESAKIKYVSYWGNTNSGVKGSLTYSDEQQIGVKSYEFSLRAYDPTVGESITLTVSTITTLEDGSTVTTPRSCTYTATGSDHSEEDLAVGLQLAFGAISFPVPLQFKMYLDASSSPSQLVVRGSATGDDFLLEVSSSSPAITNRKVFLVDTINTAVDDVITLSVTGLVSGIETTRIYSYTFVGGDDALIVADRLVAAYFLDPFSGITVGKRNIVVESRVCSLLIVTTITCSLSGTGMSEVDPTISLGAATEISSAIKPVNAPLIMNYSDTASFPVGMTFACSFGSEDQNQFIGGSDLEYVIAISSNQETCLYTIKDQGQFKAVFQNGSASNEFSRTKFNNPLDGGNNILAIYNKYFRPNLIGDRLFSIPNKPFTKDGKPLESIDVFITDLSGQNPRFEKESADLTQPSTDYFFIDASAYIA